MFSSGVCTHTHTKKKRDASLCTGGFVCLWAFQRAGTESDVTTENVKKNPSSYPFCGSSCSDVQLCSHHKQKSSSQEHWQSHTSPYLILASLCSVNSVLFFHLSFKQRLGKQEWKPKNNWVQRDNDLSFFMLTLMDVTKFLSQPSQSE